MTRQYALIGLGSFGVRVLEKLAEFTDQIIIIDKNRELVDKFKDLATHSYIADALDKGALERLLPEALDVAIVDVGSNIEVAILVVNTLKKLKVQRIIVRAENEEHGEILSIVGATQIVYPAKEAADKVVPLLVSSSLFSFMPISTSLVLAEIRLPAKYVGKTLVEANLRQTNGINVVAIRKEDSADYAYFDPKYQLCANDVLLFASTEQDMARFTGVKIVTRENSITDLLKGVFGKKKKTGAES